MTVPLRHVFRQGANLGALVNAAVIAYQSKGQQGGEIVTPTPPVSQTIAAPPADLVKDYIRHVGGNPSAYRGQVPHHLFPFWAFPLMAQSLKGVPYDVSKVLNAGVTLQMNAPIPLGEPITVSVNLSDASDKERHVLLHQRIVTGTASEPEASVAEVRMIVPKKVAKRKGPKAPPRTVPLTDREIAMWKLDAKAGLDFAILTGDFNPIHWIPPAGRAAGFRGCILHGFATWARAIEAIGARVYAGQIDQIQSVDVRFARPVPLPGRVGLYVSDDHHFHVGSAPGAPAALIGSWVPKETS